MELAKAKARHNLFHHTTGKPRFVSGEYEDDLKATGASSVVKEPGELIEQLAYYIVGGKYD